MHKKALLLTIFFIVVEVLSGTVCGELYIRQYNFWTSSQSLIQFMATVLLIYVMITFAFGAINLTVIGLLQKKMFVRCSLAAVILGSVSAFVVVTDSGALYNYFNEINLNPAMLILLGLVTGFNIGVFVPTRIIPAR